MNPGIFARSFATLTAAAVIGGGLVMQGPVALAQSAPSAAPQSSSTAPAATPSTAQHSPAAVEARIKQLHAQLKITPDEEDQWNAMAQIMRDNGSKLSELIQQRAQNARSMSAVDNLRSYEGITAEQENGLKQLVPAFEKLYELDVARPEKGCRRGLQPAHSLARHRADQADDARQAAAWLIGRDQRGDI